MYFGDQAAPAAQGHSTRLRSRRLLQLLAATLVVAAIAIATWAAWSDYTDERAAWIPLNRGSSEAVRQRVVAWANGQFKEGADLGAALAPLATAAPRAADSVATAVTDGHTLLGVWAVDDRGRVRAGSARLSTPTAAEIKGAKESVAAGTAQVIGPANVGGVIAITLITPLPDRIALLRRLNADSTLFQLADWGQRTSETAQIVLVGTRGDSAVAVSPLRSPRATAGAYVRPARDLSQLWQLAARGADTTGYFTDERGRRTLASVLPVRPLPWSVIVQVDESDVMTAPRQLLEMRIAGAWALAALIVVAVMLVRRSRRVKRLHQRVAEQGRFREVVASAMDAIIMVSPQGNILDVNPAALRLFEVEYAELVGSALISWLTGDGSDTVECALAEIGMSEQRSTPYRLRLRSAEPECLVELTGSITRTADGDESLTLFARDVTQRRRMEDAVRKSGEIALLGRVAGGLAHDFNNGLHVVLGNAELLLDGCDPTAPDRESVEAVIGGARRLAHLTSELLSFGRQQMLRSEVTDLVRFIRESEPEIRAELTGDEKDAPRTLRFLPRVPTAHVCVDRKRLREALLHVVRNARQAMPAWGQLSIEIAPRPFTGSGDASDMECTWQIIIRDSGVGMSAAVLARAREPFFSTRSRAEAQGLGLAVVDGFVEQSGGTLTLLSEPGKGTTVIMSLPPHAMSRRPAPSTENSARHVAVQSQRCALIVDDEPAVRHVVARCLEALGYRVIQARHAEHALGLLADESRVDLAISDLVMPGMNGAELRRAILRRSPTTAVVLMSGYTDDELTRRGLRDAGAVILQKPFARDTLLASIDAAILATRNIA